MIRRIQLFTFLSIVSFCCAQRANAQVEKWDLKKCVDYALTNNITVRQADLEIRFAKLDVDQSKMAQYPAATLSSNLGYSAGRNQSPSSFSLITTGYVFNNYSLQASVDLFNWFTKKNTIAARQLDYDAAKAGFEKAKDDIALNVAVAYLQILLAREQINLAKTQIASTISQLESTRKQVDAGKIPELNAVNLESLLATDSASLITAEVGAQQALLQMKALLNMDAGIPFDVVAPPVNMIPVENLADLQPEAVYSLAVKSRPQQLYDELNLKSALKSVKVARGEMYPTFSIFGSLGTTFNSKDEEAKSIAPFKPPVGTVTVGSTTYQVYPINPIYNYGKISYFDQMNQNFRQSIGLSVSVPILNNGILRTNWQRSKLTVKQRELTKEQNSFTLKQDIYTAYYDAVASLQKFNANKKAVDASQKAYDFAMKRYDLGLLSTYDLVITQNTLAKAKSEMLYSQYDYVFKIKLLEFYKGQGLKLAP